jgi:alpha-2-macroglobulin
VQAAPKIEVPVSQPKGALPQQGGVSVAWQASLADAALSEVREWMKQYPFVCLEQKASKLSVGNDRAGWDALMSELPKYLDDKGLPRFFPAQEGNNTVPGSEILAIYLIDIARFNGWSIPAEPRNLMLNALKLALDKKLPEQDWAPTKSDTARLLSLQATLMEAGVIKATQVMLNDADKLPTITLLDWVRALLAQSPSTKRTEQLNDAANLLRNRYNVQGTRLSWRNEERENWWWYMWNGNVAAARTVLVVNQWAQFDDAWKKDLPLLVKGLTARQQQGHWGTTTANVWGAIALQTFAKQTETGPVGGTSVAELGTQKLNSTWGLTPSPASAGEGRGEGSSSSRKKSSDPEPVMLPWPQQGAQEVLKLSHQGAGAPWATVSVLAALKLDKPTSQGMTIKRSITAVQQQTKGVWRVGDVMRVKLEMSSAAEMNWVVMRDPVPSGATVLGRGLARESGLAQQGQRSTGWAWPVYEERAAESYRAYYARAPRGNWSAEYTMRLNNAGKFAFPASRLEAMYAPEIFAETPIDVLDVKP